MKKYREKSKYNEYADYLLNYQYRQMEDISKRYADLLEDMRNNMKLRIKENEELAKIQSKLYIDDEKNVIL